MVAQHLGAEVFATVGSAEKKQFLIDEFSVAADHIFSSRTTAFREGILGMTEGKGVDVVLNSLTGEQFRESCNCLAEFGRFIEIGKRDLLMNARMDMGFFVKNITFSSLDLMLVGQLKPSLARQLMKESVELVSTGQVKPVNIASAPLSDIQRVFRQMQAGKHMGKFVLNADADTQVKVTCPYNGSISLSGADKVSGRSSTATKCAFRRKFVVSHCWRPRRPRTDLDLMDG
jgi:emericellamide synthase (highly reducing iterative type I polyketide synthase)